MIGFGVNCRSHPGGLAYPAADLAQSGLTLKPCDVLVALAETFTTSLALWDRGMDFAAVRRAWLEFAPPIGMPIVVTTPRGRLCGRFGGLASAGHLLLDTQDGCVTIDAGDVFLPDVLTDAMQQQT